ncbi:MAG: hypothetical protein HIU82_13965 [Proteobacteria bacterium]|nr:hypothetical protein [Pseudomonadota bacterium]
MGAKALTAEDRAVAAEERAAGMLAVLRDPQPGEARERLPDAEWARLDREQRAAACEAAEWRAERDKQAARAKPERPARLWTKRQAFAWIAWRDPHLVARYDESPRPGFTRAAAVQDAAARWYADLLYMPADRAEALKVARAEFEAWNTKGRPRLSAAAIRANWPQMTMAAFLAQIEAARQPVDRDPFIAACVEATGCTRADARKRYADLAATLKNPPGRPRAKK